MIQSNKCLRSRAGFTLVHQLIIIAIMPIVLITATTWVHESLKMSNRFKHRRESHVAMNQLTNQFQDDVHNCKSLQLNSNLNQIELTGHEDQQITFKIDGNALQKTLTVDGEVVSRESYRLSDEYFVEWDAGATEMDSNRAALNIFRHSTVYHDSAPESLDVPDPKLELTISAKANRWKRMITFGRETKPTTDSGTAE